MNDTPYNKTYYPPAPVYEIALETPEGKKVTVSAMIDTGADATLVPVHYLRDIGARRVFEVGLRSQWGEKRVVFLHLVDIHINEITLPGIYVVGDDIGNEVVLGRDILNRLHLTLDGPALLTHIKG